MPNPAKLASIIGEKFLAPGHCGLSTIWWGDFGGSVVFHPSANNSRGAVGFA
jgi:hypothetical protein